MILPSSLNEQDIVVSSKKFETSKFTIAASAKAFKILSNSLYTNKIRAVVRELGCNAYDSHVANGNPDTPFLVIAPTALAPEFTIRDYGTGMDADTVQNLYSTYFGSSKTESNDFVGALGLGSKTPFSYTDSFVVTSWINNPSGEGTIEYKFNAYISDNGEPSIAKMSERLSTEPTGVMIQVGVNPADIRDWEREIEYVYATFKVRPTVCGYSAKYSEPESVYKVELGGLSTTIYSLNARQLDSGIYILMGNIPYPIPSVVLNKVNISNITNIIGRYSRRAIMIEVPIGTVEMTPSRESLSIEGDTETILVNLLSSLNSVIVEQIIDGLKNEYKSGKSPNYIIQKLKNHNLDDTDIYNKVGIADYVSLFHRVHKDLYNSKFIKIVRYNRLCGVDSVLNKVRNISSCTFNPINIYIQDVDRLMYKHELFDAIGTYDTFVITELNKSTKRIIKGIKTVFGIKSTTKLSSMIDKIRTERAEKRKAKSTDTGGKSLSSTKTYSVYVSGDEASTKLSWNDIKKYAKTHMVYITGTSYDNVERSFTDNEFQYYYICRKYRYSYSHSIIDVDKIRSLLADKSTDYIYVPWVPCSQFIRAKIKAKYIGCIQADKVHAITDIASIRLRQSKWGLIKAMKYRFTSAMERLVTNLETVGVDLLSILGKPTLDLDCTIANLPKDSADEYIKSFDADQNLCTEFNNSLRTIGDELRNKFTSLFPFLTELDSKTYMVGESDYIDVYALYIKSVVDRESLRTIPSHYSPLKEHAPMVHSHYNPVIKRKK